MIIQLLTRVQAALGLLLNRFRQWARPQRRPIVGLVVDALRSPAALRRENALLRKQLEVVCRQIRRPRLRRADRLVLVLLARLTPTWRETVLLVQPETILRWYRRGFALFWRRRTDAPVIHASPLIRSA